MSHFHKAMAVDPTFRGAYINLSKLYRDQADIDNERKMLVEIRERFGRTSREGRYAFVRLEELNSAEGG